MISIGRLLPNNDLPLKLLPPTIAVSSDGVTVVMSLLPKGVDVEIPLKSIKHLNHHLLHGRCVSPDRVNVRLNCNLSVFNIGYSGLETWEIESLQTVGYLRSSFSNSEMLAH
ncbi:hypothetical protein Tco_1366567 [Tanacetum coccineum]